MIELDISKISNLCATTSVREPVFKTGDRVCFKDNPDVYIGSLKTMLKMGEQIL